MNSVNHMIKLGEAFSEMELEMYSVSRYPSLKKEWIKWKRMLNEVSRSDMKIDTVMNLFTYKIF